jgi:5-methyltetrahydropteroyltriglutamate--homocysteine methyltransferase
MNDIPLIEVVPFALAINAGAHSFRWQPRHYHEWHLGGRKLPDGKILIPSLIGHATNFVSTPTCRRLHHEIRNGRSRTSSSARCGFSSRATYVPEVHPTVVWPKFRALAEGAAQASKQLWG